MSFDPTKPVRTRDGREARIYARDGYGICAIHGVVLTDAGWEQFSWTLEGKLLGYDLRGYDLINIPERIERYLIVYRDGRGIFSSGQLFSNHAQATEARKCTETECIACIPISFEVGEGLEVPHD